MTNIAYSVDVDQGQVKDALSLFAFLGGNSDEAIRVATNKAVPRVRTESSKQIRSQIRLKAGYVNGRLTITKATRKNLTSKISAPSRGILLSRFSTDTSLTSDKVTWLKPPPLPARGPRVKVKPDQSPKGVAGKPGEITGKPFYMVLRNSRALAIVGRKPGGGIKVFYGPSVSQAFTDVRDDVLQEAAEIYEKELLDAVRFLLQKQYPR